MDAAAQDEKMHEALSAVGQYLSDTIPPVEAEAPVLALLNRPLQWMAAAICDWIAAQYQGNEKKASFADYLFHAVMKLQYLGHLQLIPEKVLTPYVDALKALLLESCPVEDRELLRENFGRTGVYDSAMVSPIRFMYRPQKPGSSESDPGDSQAPAQSRDRRLAIVWSRLKSAVEESAPSSFRGDEAVLPCLSPRSNCRNPLSIRREGMRPRGNTRPRHATARPSACTPSS